MATKDDNRLRTKTAAEYLGVSESTLAKWRMLRYGPPYHHCGPRIVYYLRDEIDAWLAECDRVRSAEPSSFA
jgi:predicted DNA-binding transcriptional regulator AlpA